jgi:predicted PurR-regulated permease PerM
LFKLMTLLLLLLFVYHVREVFPPFIVGAIFAYLLAPLVGMLNQKLRWPPFWSVLVIYSLTGTLLVMGAHVLLPSIAEQTNNLFENRKELVGNLIKQLSDAFSMGLNIEQTRDVLLSQIQTSVGDPKELMQLGGVVSKSLLSLLVCFVTSIYMLVDSKRVGRFFLRFIPHEKRATVISLSGQMNVMFRKYVWGQAFLITFMSFVALGILSYFHIKYALLIAIMTGFLEIVPVLGPLLAIIVATGFGVAQLGLAKAGGIALCYWIARLVEDYIVVPNTIGHAVELHPLAVIFAVVVGETMAGALGMLIAIPVAASVKVVLDFCYPSPSPTQVHHDVKNPMAWMLDMFKRPPAQHVDLMMRQAELDAIAIEAMHSASGGTESAKKMALDKQLSDKQISDKHFEDAISKSNAAAAAAAAMLSAAVPSATSDKARAKAESFDPEATTTPQGAARASIAAAAQGALIPRAKTAAGQNASKPAAESSAEESSTAQSEAAKGGGDSDGKKSTASDTEHQAESASKQSKNSEDKSARTEPSQKQDKPKPPKSGS